MATQPPQLHNLYYTISAGQPFNAATPLDIRLVEPVSLIMPSAWTEAAISFSGSPTSQLTDYGWLANSSAKIIRISPGKAYHHYMLSKSWFTGVNWLFIVSGDLTLGLAGLVNQVAARTLILNCRDRSGTPMPTPAAMRI